MQDLHIRKLYSLGRKHCSVVCVIPPEVLRTAGVKSGEWVEVRADNQVIVIERVKPGRHVPRQAMIAEREIDMKRGPVRPGPTASVELAPDPSEESP